MMKEFKAFAIKGNVIDLAVGVIIGSAFAKIVDSLVQDIIMPIASKLFGGLDFTNYYLPLNDQGTHLTLIEGKKRAPCSLMAASSRSCLIFSSSPFIFQMVRAPNKAKKTESAPTPEPASTPEDTVLLRETRDVLKK